MSRLNRQTSLKNALSAKVTVTMQMEEEESKYFKPRVHMPIGATVCRWYGLS